VRERERERDVMHYNIECKILNNNLYLDVVIKYMKNEKMKVTAY
jgi:hypothetical protein